MSNREKAVNLLNVIDDDKMVYVVGILENLAGFIDIPNAETVAAIQEGDVMLENGSGQRFEGSTEDFFAKLLEE